VGTNYYIHIGKRSAGPATGGIFTWAIPPGILGLLSPGAPIIQNEYGDSVTVGEFIAQLEGADSDHALVGQAFS